MKDEILLKAEVSDSDPEAPPAPTKSKDPSSTRKMREIDEPYMDLADIVKRYTASNIDVDDVEKSGGLSSDKAATLLEENGPNVLTPPPKMPEWKRFLLQFKNMFMILLNVCGVLSLIAYFSQTGPEHDPTNLYLALVLFVVVFLTCFIQFHEEGKALSVMDSFSKMLAQECTVLRDGRQQEVPVGDLVVGDLVLIKDGNKVPADMVLLLCRGLKAECSSLTGESEPISCTAKKSAIALPLFECKNLVFSSSLCFDGMAIGLVVGTGDDTAIGTIASLASSTELRESTLQIEVRRFVLLIACIAVCMATVFFVAGVFLSKAKTARDISRVFVNGFLVIIVANTPQGLPATVTSLLSLAARNMAKRNVLVKRIDSVETLGSTSLICSDKTGTLTKNEMTVTDVWCDRHKLRLRTNRMPGNLHGNDPLSAFIRAASLCNRAQFITPETMEEDALRLQGSIRNLMSSVSRLSWASSVPGSILDFANSKAHIKKFKGNPSDVALAAYCDHLTSVSRLRSDYPVLFEIPFNSKNKWQLILVKSFDSGTSERHLAGSEGATQYEIVMKGAPEVILARCTTFVTKAGDNHQAPIDEAFRTQFSVMYESLAAEGKRVLALASATFTADVNTVFGQQEDGSYNFPTNNLNFIGLAGIVDPPRDDVPGAISKCHDAGVKVFMVTGDHPLTGRAIARQIGLLKSTNNIELLEDVTTDGDWSSYDGAVIHGCRIEGLTDKEWTEILAKEGAVFARTTPAHKLEIVRRSQGMGYIVAVSGDGVNDAPALKQADVGIAMGLNGSDVAQESADIVLMDDNFASIVNGIEEGRIIFDNIKKTIAYTMAHILPEVISAALRLLFLLPLGLTAMQVLTIDLGTEMGPAISLAYEKAESNIMKRKPRDPKKDRLVSGSLLFYSYVIAGSMISGACFLSYVFIYAQHGIRITDLPALARSAPGGDFFSLTSSEEATIDRTGQNFSASEQRNIFSQAVTAFYITLTVSQFFHIWVCKTRTISLFVHGFSNTLTFYGVLAGLVLVIFFSYIPGVHAFVGSAFVNWTPWVVVPITGAVIWTYTETVKWYHRKQPDNTIGNFLVW